MYIFMYYYMLYFFLRCWLSMLRLALNYLIRCHPTSASALGQPFQPWHLYMHLYAPICIIHASFVMQQHQYNNTVHILCETNNKCKRCTNSTRRNCFGGKCNV